jgi:hypothetical protein
MFPNPGWQAQQTFERSRRFRELNDQMDGQRRRSRRGSGSGLRGFLTFLLLVAAIAYVAHDPELRTSAITFARHLLTRVQSS